MLNNLSISKKLYSGFTLMFLILIVVSIIGIMKVDFIDKTLNEVVEVNSVKQRYAINFRGSVHDRAIAIRDLVLSKNKNDELFKTSLSHIKKLEKYYLEAAKPMDEIFKKGIGVDSKERKILEDIKNTDKITLPLIYKIIELKSNDEHVEAKKVLLEQASGNFTHWLKVINQFIDYEEEKNQIQTPKAREVASSFSYVMLSILIVAIVIGSLVAFVISNELIKSVSKVQIGLENFFSFLNKKIDNASIIDLNSKDEFGQMAQTINSNIKDIETSVIKDDEFVKDIARFAKEIGEGNFLAKVEKTTNTKSLLDLKEILIKMQSDLENTIANSVPVLLEVLKSFKNYDFTARFPNAKANVAIAINELGDVISELLNQSFKIGETLENSSNKLIINVEELNISSNEAAASLEQTAAALEEITSLVTNNSNNVIEMTNYSTKVNNSAKEGQKLAKSTSNSMTEIEEQVNAINDAISIIDQIAFQTNILSLNAAVEAATAGEAGKGFAVVAAEVRNLANRSAEAAKEIKDIVENATVKATYGKSIGDKMTEGYAELLNNIEKSTQIIQNIASSSKEQEQGISQINDAVTLLDKQTQKNALIASETKDIASSTDEIAKEIVLNLEDKNFKGKENI